MRARKHRQSDHDDDRDRGHPHRQAISGLTLGALLKLAGEGLRAMLPLAGALAFGLGGRDVAARMPQDAYDAGQRNKALRGPPPRPQRGGSVAG